MSNDEIVRELRECKIIAIVRGANCDVAELAGALYRGGIRFVEFTFNQSDPERLYQTAANIKLASKALPEMLIGAGTVLTTEQARMAHDAGARFIISPDVNPEVIEETKRLGMLSMPGALTPTEIMQAHSAGADIVKIFPAASLGPAYIKAVRAPLSHIPLMAVGGINLTNAASFLNAGAIGLGIGGNLVNTPNDPAQTEQTAREYVEAVK